MNILSIEGERRKIKDEVNDIDKSNSELFEKKFQRAKVNHSTPFDIDELDNVLKSLKLGKCRDLDNYICELFKEGVICINPKIAILMMINRMNNKTTIPPCPKRANITILHKKKLQTRS